MRKTITMSELITQMGNEIYAGTDVTPDDQKRINDYFQLNRLCARPDRFLVYFRRRINAYYPIYRDSVEMWAERKTYDWLYDAMSSRRKNHSGKDRMNEKIMDEIKRLSHDIAHDITHGTGKTDENTSSKLVHDGTSGYDLSGNSTDHSDGKSRGFSFNYPESNYTGGVIPYDLNNDPSVEFIDTQSDGVNRSDSNSEHSENQSESNEYTDNGTTTSHQDNVSDTTYDHSGDRSDNDNRKSDREQNRTDVWEENETINPGRMDAIVGELMEQIPRTPFFLQLVLGLRPCFQAIYDEPDAYSNFC